MNDDNKGNEDYRRVIATATKLETIQSNLESVIDFFLAPIVKLYSKLCNDCLKLLFECEFKLEHFRRVEELVWKRVYHDIYRFQKTKRQIIKRHDESLMESHFISGIGFYSTLIVRLRTHYQIYDACGIINPLNLSLGPIDNFAGNKRLNQEDDFTARTHDRDNSISTDPSSEPVSTKAQDWARQAIYRSLIYMGDLARYLLETSQFNYRYLAFEFYLSASRNQPDYGLPFNQLATLAGSHNNNLDAVCNYMRCCLKLKPFEGAETNMKKLFELNNRFYEELMDTDYISRISDVYSSKDPEQAAESLMRTTIVTFIKLTSDLWFAISSSEQAALEGIIQTTKLFFEILREALELEPIVPLATSTDFEQEFCPISCGSSNPRKPKYVSPTIMYEFCSVSMMLITKCQRHQASKGNVLDPLSANTMDLINTLALNLLHYSTTKCQKMIIGKVQELRMSRCDAIDKGACQLFESLKSSGCNSSNNSQKSYDNLNIGSRKTLSRLRQKKAAAKFTDSNNKPKPVARNSEDSDLSELEETALSIIDALEISSGLSDDVDNHESDLINLDSSSSDENIKTPRRKTESTWALGSYGLSRPIVRPTRSQNFETRNQASNFASSSNSLPMPDLVTGDLPSEISLKVDTVNQSPIGSTDGSEKPEKQSPSTSEKQNDTNDLESVMAYTYTQTYLPTIKIYCDWLLANGAIIGSNLQSFYEFCAELTSMINSLNDLRKLASISDNELASKTISTDQFSNSCNNSQSDADPVYSHTFDGPDWTQKYPLSCDHPLFDLSPLKSVHETNIDFRYRKELNNSEAGFITIQCIIAFSQALTVFLENKNF